MRDSDKPFVMYRRGPWNFTIVPRGTSGWVQFGIWMAMLVPLTIGFAIYAEAHEGQPVFYAALALYLVATLVWSIAMIRWMRARSEVVDVEKLLRLKREAERKKRR